MKDRPILFSGPMVRALLDGSKTQTRRIIKPRMRKSHAPIVGAKFGEPCPYGQPGDRLWVRETWASLDGGGVERTIYRADDNDSTREIDKVKGWRPSIHMPWSRSRLTLEITNVRCERLQDISEADAIAEGIEVLDAATGLYRDYTEPFAASTADDPRRGMCFNAVDSYQSLWNSINGPGAWDANPWVWVVEFKRITPTTP